MADTKALQLILDSKTKLKKINFPPDDYSLKSTEAYVKQCTQILNSTKVTTTKVTSYMQTVKDKLNELIQILNDYCKMLQEAVAKALKRLKDKQSSYGKINPAMPSLKNDDHETKPVIPKGHSRGRDRQRGANPGLNGSPSKPEKKKDSSKQQIQLLLNLAKQNGSLQDFIAKSNTCFDTNFTVSDIEDLEEHLDDWKRQTAKTFKGEKEIEEMERKDKERNQNNPKKPPHPEKQTGETSNKGKPEKNKKEENKKDEEERLKHEAEQKRIEEEEEQQQRLKHEEEQRKMKEEDERRREEEETRKEEEERRKADERKLQQEEEERKKQLIEEERLRRLDPKNWKTQVYHDAVDDNKNHRDGVCCVVTAQDGGIEHGDLNCSIAHDVDNSSDFITEDDERIASYIITVDSVNGMVNLEAPMQVFLPHVDINEDEDELIIKSSIDGGPWMEDTPTRPAKPVQGMDTKQMSKLAGKQLNSFKTAKLVAVSRPKLDQVTMGEVGGRIQLPSDDTISITVPPGSFDRETVVRTQAVPVNDAMMESINKGSSSASSVIYVRCAQPPAKPLTVDITGQNDMETPSMTSYTLVKEDSREWQFADINTCGQTTTVNLPMQTQRFCIIEVRLLLEEPCQIALDVALAVYARTTFTPARLIIKQNQADPSSGIIQCVRSKEVDSTLRYLLSKGYGIGPDVSREIYIREGTHIEATCIRNLLFVTDDQATKKTICFFANWGCSEEVSFGIKSKYFQRDYVCFSGDVISTFHRTCDTNNPSDCDLTITHKITLPKTGWLPTRIFGNIPLETIALTNCVSFLLINKCSHHWQVILSNLCGGSKLRTVKREAEGESGSQSFDHQHLCKLVISDWIKSKPVHFNKFAAVKYVFESSGYATLVEPLTVYINSFKEQMSDEAIRAVAASVTKDVSDVIEDLDLTDDESNEFLNEYHDETRGQIEALIYGWRLTNNAIGAGSNALDLLKHILELKS